MEESKGRPALRRTPLKEGVTTTTTIEHQMSEWVEGRSHHNTTSNECCPDFSCCEPALLADKETRIAFRDASESVRLDMLLMFLGTMLAGSETHIAGGPYERGA